MSTSHRGLHAYFRLSLATCWALAVVAGFSGADLRPVSTSGKTAPAVDTVELFAAVEQGDIEARFIPKNSRRGRIILKNNTNRPLSIRLPEAFVGVPVLAQFGNFPGMNQGAGRNGLANGNGNNNANQAVGGPMAPTGNGRNQRRGGFFNLPAERVMEFEVVTVCLEHGKHTPRPVVPYALQSVESFTSKPSVQALLRIMADGNVDQRSAQAAAWHLANGMTWEQLAAKRIEHISGSSEPYFAASQLEEAVELVKKASAEAANRSASNGTSSSGG